MSLINLKLFEFWKYIYSVTFRHILFDDACHHHILQCVYCKIHCTSFLLTFFSFLFRGIIKVRIIDDEEYEKNETFYLELDEPELYQRASGKHDHEEIKQNIFWQVNVIRLDSVGLWFRQLLCLTVCVQKTILATSLELWLESICLPHIQMTRTLRLISIRHQANVKVSDWCRSDTFTLTLCLIKINLRVFAIWVPV